MRIATPAADQLTRLGIPFQLHEYTITATHDGIGIAAAQAIKADPARVLKTLIIEAGAQSFAMALIRVDAELDLKAAAHALKIKKAAMAEIKQAERITGYIKGGISPLGQKKSIPALIDQQALTFPTIFISGGQRGLEIELAPHDLVQALNMTPAPLTRG